MRKIASPPLRRAVLTYFALGVGWVVAALVRQGSTFHLAPFLVARAVPVILARDLDHRIETRSLSAASLPGLLTALGFTVMLTLADRMSGPSVLPFGVGR